MGTPVLEKVGGTVAVSIGQDDSPYPSTRHWRNHERTYVFCRRLGNAASAATVASAQRAFRPRRSSRCDGAAASTDLGNILVSSSGRTLYEFTRDHANKTAARRQRVPAVWPSLRASVGRRPLGRQGFAAVHNERQPGHLCRSPALHLQWRRGPGKTSYVGANTFGGTWYAITHLGHGEVISGKSNCPLGTVRSRRGLLVGGLSAGARRQLGRGRSGRCASG